MELRHLRYFSAIASKLSFTQAAEAVHVTQSTLSHQIRQLEEGLGVQLFQRAGRGVALTEEGQAFSRFVANALREVDQGIWTLKQRAMDAADTLRIGATQTFNMAIIPRCVEAFHARNALVHISISEMSNEAIIEGLRTGHLDLGVTHSPSDSEGLHFEALYTEELLLAVSAKHPMARRNSIRMVELHRQPLVLLPRSFATRQLLDRCFQAANAEPQVSMELDSIGLMLEIISRTTLGGIIPESAQNRSDIRLVPIESPTPTRTPGMLWRTDMRQDPNVQWFASHVRLVAAESTSPRRPRRKSVRRG